MQIKLLICLISGGLVFAPVVTGILCRAGSRNKTAAVRAPGRWPGWLWAGAVLIYEHLPKRLFAAGQLKAGSWARTLYPGRKPADMVLRHQIRLFRNRIGT